MAESIEINSDAGRFDVLVEVGKTHPDGSVELTFRPHPDRYIWRDDETEGRVLYDVKTRTVFPETVLRDMAEQMMAGIPFHMPPNDLPDAEDLLAERKAAIEASLSGASPGEELASPSEAELAKLVGDRAGTRAQSHLWSGPCQSDPGGHLALEAERCDALELPAHGDESGNQQIDREQSLEKP